MGTLIQNTQAHPGPAVSAPPSSTPTAAPAPPSADQTPNALVSSPPVNVRTMTESAAGDIAAAPMPCRARPISSISMLVAKPASSEASVNIVRPVRTTGRGPTMSAAFPPNSISPPNSRA